MNLSFNRGIKKYIKLFMVFTIFLLGLGFIIFNCLFKFGFYSHECEPSSNAEVPIVNSEINENIPKKDSHSFEKDFHQEEYIIKEFKGNIAVFEKDKIEPFKKTDVNINELPDADKKMLKEGIIVKTKEELNEILEDYCS